MKRSVATIPRPSRPRSPCRRSARDKTPAELAQQHQVRATQIGAWKQQLLEHATELFGSAQRRFSIAAA